MTIAFREVCIVSAFRQKSFAWKSVEKRRPKRFSTSIIWEIWLRSQSGCKDNLLGFNANLLFLSAGSRLDGPALWFPRANARDPVFEADVGEYIELLRVVGEISIKHMTRDVLARLHTIDI